MLHTVNKSPFASATLSACIEHITPGAALLLIEDGVTGAVAGTPAADLLAAILGRCPVYVLQPDLAARGLREARLLPGVELVDYAGFVRLVVAHEAVQAWL